MVVLLVSSVPITLLNYIYVLIPIWFLNWCPSSVRFFSFPQQLRAKRNGYNKYTDVIYLKELFADIITLFRLFLIWAGIFDWPFFFPICAKEVGRHHFINLRKKASRAAESKTRREKGRATFFLPPSPSHFLAFVSIFMLCSEENACILCRLLFYLKGLVSWQTVTLLSVSEWGVNHRNLVLSIESSEESQFNSVVI